MRGVVVVAAVALAAAYGWWAVGREPFTWQSAVAVLVPGVAVAVAAAAWGRPDRRASRRAGGGADLGSPPGVRAWAALAVIAAVWQLAAYVQTPRDDHPTISSLTNAVLDTHAARTAGFVVWLVVTAALVRR